MQARDREPAPPHATDRARKPRHALTTKSHCSVLSNRHEWETFLTSNDGVTITSRQRSALNARNQRRPDHPTRSRQLRQRLRVTANSSHCLVERHQRHRPWLREPQRSTGRAPASGQVPPCRCPGSLAQRDAASGGAEPSHPRSESMPFTPAPRAFDTPDPRRLPIPRRLPPSRAPREGRRSRSATADKLPLRSKASAKIASAVASASSKRRPQYQAGSDAEGLPGRAAARPDGATCMPLGAAAPRTRIG